MSKLTPVARSPIAPGSPVRTVAGWEVTGRRSQAPLTLADWTPLAKVLVRADGDGEAPALGVALGRAGRDGRGTLVVGSGPGEWTLLGPPGTAGDLVGRWQTVDGERLVTVVDLTSALALMRLTGEEGHILLAKVCAVDLHHARTPNGTAFRSSVAKVVSDVVRDDAVLRNSSSPTPVRSYLLHCDRSYGQYLFDALLDAGSEFGIDVDGFSEEDLSW